MSKFRNHQFGPSWDQGCGMLCWCQGLLDPAESGCVLQLSLVAQLLAAVLRQ